MILVAWMFSVQVRIIYLFVDVFSASVHYLFVYLEIVDVFSASVHYLFVYLGVYFYLLIWKLYKLLFRAWSC